MRCLRVASFNILHGVLADGSGRVDLDALVRAVLDLDADIVALQEVDVGVPRSGRVDQAAFVADALGMEVVFGKAAHVGGIGRYGNALLARGAIRDVEVLPLPRAARGHEPRAAILATAEIDGTVVSVCATHLSIHRPEVHDQLAAVVAALAARPGPLMLIGDLNLLSEEVAPVVEAAGMALAPTDEPTFPRAEPRVRIDHVAVRGLDITGVEVVPTESSDHCALIVRLDARTPLTQASPGAGTGANDHEPF